MSIPMVVPPPPTQHQPLSNISPPPPPPFHVQAVHGEQAPDVSDVDGTVCSCSTTVHVCHSSSSSDGRTVPTSKRLMKNCRSSTPIDGEFLVSESGANSTASKRFRTKSPEGPRGFPSPGDWENQTNQLQSSNHSLSLPIFVSSQQPFIQHTTFSPSASSLSGIPFPSGSWSSSSLSAAPPLLLSSSATQHALPSAPNIEPFSVVPQHALPSAPNIEPYSVVPQHALPSAPNIEPYSVVPVTHQHALPSASSLTIPADQIHSTLPTGKRTQVPSVHLQSFLSSCPLRPSQLMAEARFLTDLACQAIDPAIFAQMIASNNGINQAAVDGMSLASMRAYAARLAQPATQVMVSNDMTSNVLCLPGAEDLSSPSALPSGYSSSSANHTVNGMALQISNNMNQVHNLAATNSSCSSWPCNNFQSNAAFYVSNPCCTLEMPLAQHQLAHASSNQHAALASLSGLYSQKSALMASPPSSNLLAGTTQLATSLASSYPSLPLATDPSTHHVMQAMACYGYQPMYGQPMLNSAFTLPSPSYPPVHTPYIQAPNFPTPMTTGSDNYSFYHTYALGPAPELLPPPSHSFAHALSAGSQFFYPSDYHALDIGEVQKKEICNNLLKVAHEKYNTRDYASCLALLLEICKVYPTHLPTLLLIGCTYYSLEQYELSIFYNKQIIARDPKFAEAYSNLGTTYRAMNRIEDAEACYRRAIALKPKYWDAICNLASLLNCSNRFDEAITFYESIVSIDKQGASIWTPERRRDIYFNIGNLRFLSGDVFKTKQDLLKALDAVGVRIGQQVPNLSVVVRSHETTASILQTLAKIFQDENAVNCAIACYYTALGLFPTANACNNLGILLSALGLPERTDEAIQWYSYGLSIDPGHVHILTNLGSALKERGRMMDGIACYQRAIAIQPDFFIALANLGNSFKDIGKHEEAIECYRRALIVKPYFVDAFCNYVHSVMFVCDWRERDKSFVRIREIVDSQICQPIVPGRPVTAPTVLPFHTFTYPLNIRQIREISVRNAARIQALVNCSDWVSKTGYPKPTFSPGQRLKIGYGTTYRTKIEAESEHFLDVSTWSVPKIIDRIVHDGIHVLINLNGYTKGARNEIFAARPCPLQIAYMGFAGTMGAEWIDYFVVDEVVAPRCIADLEDGLYTEKFIYMPHSYFVNDHRQGFRDGVLERIENGVLKPLSDIEYQVYRRHWRRSLFPDLADDVIIFANFNQLYKIDPRIFKVWLRILHKVPNSIIWLLKFPALGQTHLTRFATEYTRKHFPHLHEEDLARRIIFTDVAAKNEHIIRGIAADLFLDTPECNAHTTAADILWAGTPILTFPKIKMASRVAAGMCFAIGLNELVVRSYHDYENKAVQLSTTPERLTAIRTYLIHHRESSRLFDTQRWVRNFEQGIVKAWHRHLDQKEKRDIVVWDTDEVEQLGKEYVEKERKRQVEQSIPLNLDELVKKMTARDMQSDVE